MYLANPPPPGDASNPRTCFWLIACIYLIVGYSPCILISAGVTALLGAVNF